MKFSHIERRGEQSVVVVIANDGAEIIIPWHRDFIEEDEKRLAEVMAWQQEFALAVEELPDSTALRFKRRVKTRLRRETM